MPNKFRVAFSGLIFAVFLMLLAASSALASDIGVTVTKAASVINLDDVIVPGDTAKLEAVLRQAKAQGLPIYIMLDSRGGDVDEGMAMGRLLRRYGVSTMHKSCSSSCVFIFMGGVNRFAHTNLGQSDEVKLGVHRPEMGEAHVASPNAFTTAMMKMLKDYTIEMSGSDAFYNFMMQIPFSSLYDISYAEAVRLNVVNQALP